jgi:tetratricopeptide (TPR) repeat protein
MTAGRHPSDSQAAAEAGRTAPLGAPSSAAVAPSAQPPGETPALGGPGLGELWRSLGGPASALPEDARYRVGALLGMGATAQVWEVEDRNLERKVAVKVMVATSQPESVQHFFGEARLMALLDHPNVLPVHEAAFTAAGEPYFAMKRIAGTTLGEALLAAAEGKPSPRLSGTSAAVAILIDVAKAVSYAHHHGVVHQDIKPDNILLGDYGEVLLLDWGSALRQQPDGTWQGGIYGTPLYMAPEQARRERVGAPADVYALGATLFHALLGRVPCWSDDPDAFWRMRQRGEIQAPTAAERSQVPPPLLSIALTALAPSPQDRYASADAFLRDLQSYQAGLAVAAHRDSLWRFLGRWCRAHRQSLAASAVVAAALALAALAWYRSWAREQASWREAMSEDFQRPLAAIGADWRLSQCPPFPAGMRLADAPLTQGSPWRPGAAGFACEPGSLIIDLTCRRSFSGDVRVEWDEVSPKSGRGLNCFFGSDRQHGYTFHVGGWGDSTLVVLTYGADLARLMWDHIPALEPGRAHHLAMEHVDRSIRLEIDGASALEYQGIGGMDAPDRPTFGFEGVVDPVEISRVRVFTRSPPQLVSPLAVPDALYRAGDWQQASAAYEALAAAYPRTEIAPRAVFGHGLALARAGNSAEADALLGRFMADYPRHEDVPFAIWERVRLAQLRHDAAREERLRQELGRFRGQAVLASVLNELSEARCALLALAPVRAVGDVAYPPGRIAAVEAACREMAKWSDAYGVPWSNTRFCAEVVLWLTQAGGDRFVTEHFAGMDDAFARAACDRARINLGEHRELLADPRALPNWRERALFDVMDPAMFSAPAERQKEYVSAVLYNQALQRQLAAEGRAAVAPAIARMRTEAQGWAARNVNEPDLPMNISHCLLLLGRDDELLGRFPSQLDDVGVIALVRLQSGRQQEGAALARALARMSLHIGYESQDSSRAVGLCAAHDLLPALVDLDDGKAVDLADLEAAVRDRCEQQLWYLVRFARGEIDEAAFRAQPEQVGLAERLAVAKGLRAEWAHQPAAALAAYRDALAPSWEPDVIGHIAQWRRMRLGDRE